MISNQKLGNDPIYARVLNERAGVLKRQELIKKIQEKKENTKVITYISKYGHPAAMINSDDTIPIDDMLRSVGKTKNLELIIHSSGGYSENAKKIVKMCREYCENFTVVVPDAAKSAATIISLGGDKIIMSNTSELGPIDPQFIIFGPQGQPQTVPAWTIVRSFNEIIEDAVDENGKIKIAYIPLLNNINIAKVKEAKESLNNAKNIAEEFLKEWMLKDNSNKAEETSEVLAKGEKYTLHAHLIDWKEAKSLLNDTNIIYLPPDNDIWMLYWELYVRTAVFLSDNIALVKLFENENNSISIHLSVK